MFLILRTFVVNIDLPLDLITMYFSKCELGAILPQCNVRHGRSFLCIVHVNRERFIREAGGAKETIVSTVQCIYETTYGRWTLSRL